jgi:hypothetical protein
MNIRGISSPVRALTAQSQLYASPHMYAAGGTFDVKMLRRLFKHIEMYSWSGVCARANTHTSTSSLFHGRINICAGALYPNARSLSQLFHYLSARTSIRVCTSAHSFPPAVVACVRRNSTSVRELLWKRGVIIHQLGSCCGTIRAEYRRAPQSHLGSL